MVSDNEWCRGGDKCIKQPVHSYQSVGTTRHTPQSGAYTTNMCSSINKTTQVAQSSSERVFNEGVTESSKPSCNGRFGYKSFPMFNISGEPHQVKSPQIDISIDYIPPKTTTHVHGMMGASPIGHNFPSLKGAGEESLTPRRPCQDIITGSTQIVLFKGDKGKAPLSSFANKIYDVEGKKRVWPSNPTEDFGSFPLSTSRLLKEKQTFGGTSPGSKFKSKMISTGLLNFPAGLGLGRQSKLHLPGSSGESEGNDKVEVVKNLGVKIRNESSAETNTMDMDNFQEQQSYLSPSGVNPASLNMDILAGQDQASEQIKDFTYLPDIKAAVSSALSVASTMDNTGHSSSSRTQSFDPDHVLSGAEQPSSNPLSDHHVSNVYPRPEPGSRWLKRPRLSAPESFAVGTKCASLGDDASHYHDKAKKNSSEFVEGGSGGVGYQICHDGNASFNNLNGGSHSSSLATHSWIRRWLSRTDNAQASAQQNKPAAEEEEETKKMEHSGGDLKSKQFPSIAAMALMGKVMTGFEPCEFKRRGSFLVWNTKDISE